MKPNCVLASIAIGLVPAACASAVVIEQPLTPEFIKRHPEKFSVRARKLDFRPAAADPSSP